VIGGKLLLAIINGEIGDRREALAFLTKSTSGCVYWRIVSIKVGDEANEKRCVRTSGIRGNELHEPSKRMLCLPLLEVAAKLEAHAPSIKMMQPNHLCIFFNYALTFRVVWPFSVVLAVWPFLLAWLFLVVWPLSVAFRCLGLHVYLLQARPSFPLSLW
jgi:hypothetical protein